MSFRADAGCHSRAPLLWACRCRACSSLLKKLHVMPFRHFGLAKSVSLASPQVPSEKGLMPWAEHGCMQGLRVPAGLSGSLLPVVLLPCPCPPFPFGPQKTHPWADPPRFCSWEHPSPSSVCCEKVSAKNDPRCDWSSSFPTR